MLTLLNDSSQLANPFGEQPFRGSTPSIPPHKGGTIEGNNGLIWTKERVKYLRDNGDTLSASQMAEQLGCGLSRGAVIGKMRRLGISLSKTSTTTHLTRSAVSLPIEKTAGPPQVPTPSRKKLPTPLAEEVGGEPRMIQLADLRATECRWPIGDPSEASFGFCGHRTEAVGKPYCAAHGLRAYRRAEA